MCWRNRWSAPSRMLKTGNLAGAEKAFPRLIAIFLNYLLYAAEDELRFWRDRWPRSRDGETLSPDPEGCAQPLPRSDLRREWHGKGAGCAVNPLSRSAQRQTLHSR